MNLKHTFLRMCAIALAIAPLAAAIPAQADTILAPGTLIKGSGAAVYYYAVDGKRYVFPNSQTYFTWYTDFSGVITISDGQLGAIMIGGNVTYRPGVKLVKITTDPKVYAVDAGGTLRWVETADVAASLYGANWNTKVDDIPDAFFINYKVGTDIVGAADFAPATAMGAATSINVDKQLMGAAPSTPPTPTGTTTTSTTTSTPATITSTADTMTFTVSKPTVQPNDTETLTVQYMGSDAVAKIELFFNGVLIKTCNSTSCSGDTQVPTSSSGQSYVAEGRLTKLTTQVLDKTITVPVETDGSTLVTVQVGQRVVTSGQNVSVMAQAASSIAVNRIDISVDGTIVQGCATGARSCSWSNILNGTTGSAHPVFAVVTDNMGRTYTSAVSTITIGTNDTPDITVSPAKTTIYAGETVDVTVTATNNDGVASIAVLNADGSILKQCNNSLPCTATTGPWNTAGAILDFGGEATGSNGTVATATSMESVSVVAQPSGY